MLEPQEHFLSIINQLRPLITTTMLKAMYVKEFISNGMDLRACLFKYIVQSTDASVSHDRNTSFVTFSARCEQMSAHLR